jgi:hypothetical protein
MFFRYPLPLLKVAGLLLLLLLVESSTTKDEEGAFSSSSSPDTSPLVTMNF